MSRELFILEADTPDMGWQAFRLYHHQGDANNRAEVLRESPHETLPIRVTRYVPASEVAAAVEAERERCAGIADGCRTFRPHCGIAAAIRKEPTDES